MKIPPGIIGGVVLGAISCSSPASHLSSPPTSSPPTPSRESRCVATITHRHWPAGDLCDTLTDAPNAGIWARANTLNGWVAHPHHCWDTASTTGTPYILCWDGRIKKVSRNS